MSLIIPNSLFQFLTNLNFTSTPAVICFTLMVVFMLNLIFILKPSPEIFLLDFACYKPPSSLACTKEMVLKRLRQYGDFSEESLEFMKKTLETLGSGESTYLPEGLARKEAEMVMFGAVDELLAKTGVKGEEIGIVVVNCSSFKVVPSLSSMIVNRYKLREGVLSYNLGGMGCSAGLLAIGMAKNLLKVG
ncbi:hypothetical protein AAG906_021274 [Vitis piasezkii]